MMEGEVVDNSGSFDAPESGDTSANNFKGKKQSEGKKTTDSSEGSDDYVINPPTIETLENSKIKEKKERVSTGSESSQTTPDEPRKKSKGKRNRVSPASESSLTSLDDTESENKLESGKKLETQTDMISTASESSLTSLDETKTVKRSTGQKKRYQKQVLQLNDEKKKWEDQEKVFQERIKTWEDQEKVFQENIKILKDEVENLKTKCKDLKLQRRNNERKFKEVTTQLDATKADLQKSQNTETEMKKIKTDLEKRLEDIQTESKQYQNTTKIKDRDIKALEKKNKELETAITKLNKEKETEVNKLQKENLEFKNATNKEKAALQLQIKEKDNALKSKTEENKNFVASARCTEEQYQSREREFNKAIKNLTDGKSRAEALVYEKQRFIEQMQTALNNHVSTIISLERDKKDLTLRLSKLAGANLTYNNPNIADLSDENRPTKLAEEFSELYDNEWTDAFEKIDMSDEREKTQFMLKILKRASDLCHDTSKRHMTAIKHSFSTLSVEELKVEKVPATESGKDSTTTKIQGGEATEAKEKELTDDDVNTLPSVNVTEMSHEGDDATSENGEATDEKNKNKEPTHTNDNCHQLKSVNGGELSENKEEEANDENRNAAKVVQTTNNGKQSTRVNGTELRMGEKGDTGKTEDDADTGGNIMNNNLDTPLPESDDEDLEKSGENKDDEGTDGNFMDNKIESDPPKSSDHDKQLLETGECDTGERKEPREASVQNEPISEAPSEQAQTTYIEISVDFEKQLANEQKKTILDLRKMVENQLSKEFQEVAKGIIVKQLSADQQNEDSIVTYIEACVAICWSMCRHEPPVHIYFPETEEDTKYDTNMFKPYTKTGKLLDYIVWPALYLHEGGPMLAKGVAQGRNMNTC